MKRSLPSLITSAGFVLGLAGALLFRASPLVGSALLLLSLAFDCVDGFVARRLGVATSFGAALDWSVDVALSFAIVLLVFPVGWRMAAFVGLVVIQTIAKWKSWRFSGRALATAGCAGIFLVACAASPERSSNTQLAGVYEAQLLDCVARAKAEQVRTGKSDADAARESRACRCDVMTRWHRPKPYCLNDGGADQ